MCSSSFCEPAGASATSASSCGACGMRTMCQKLPLLASFCGAVDYGHGFETLHESKSGASPQHR